VRSGFGQNRTDEIKGLSLARYDIKVAISWVGVHTFPAMLCGPLVYEKSRILSAPRKALEKAVDGTPLPRIPSWQQNKSSLEWLHSL
jgi:hypothetical protein